MKKKEDDNVPKQSAYLKKVQSAARQRVVEENAVRTQMCMDAAMIAANEVFQMGPGRAPAFATAFSEALSEIAEMTISDTRDMEYTKVKLDKRLEEICGKAFVPWEKRYG